MLVVLKREIGEPAVNDLTAWLRMAGLGVQRTDHDGHVRLAALGDPGMVDWAQVAKFPAVESVAKIGVPFKLASRAFHPQDTIITVGRCAIGSDQLAMMAGPCSVEGEEQAFTIAAAVAAAGATIMRGGAYKPRTSPYSFQGLGEEGLELGPRLEIGDATEELLERRRGVREPSPGAEVVGGPARGQAEEERLAIHRGLQGRAEHHVLEHVLAADVDDVRHRRPRQREVALAPFGEERIAQNGEQPRLEFMGLFKRDGLIHENHVQFFLKHLPVIHFALLLPCRPPCRPLLRLPTAAGIPVPLRVVPRSR